jgi:hypothetical protein
LGRFWLNLQARCDLEIGEDWLCDWIRHAFPPFGADCRPMPINMLVVQIWVFGVRPQSWCGTDR